MRISVTLLTAKKYWKSDKNPTLVQMRFVLKFSAALVQRPTTPKKEREK